MNIREKYIIQRYFFKISSWCIFSNWDLIAIDMWSPSALFFLLACFLFDRDTTAIGATKNTRSDKIAHNTKQDSKAIKRVRTDIDQFKSTDRNDNHKWVLSSRWEILFQLLFLTEKPFWPVVTKCINYPPNTMEVEIPGLPVTLVTGSTSLSSSSLT